MFNIPAYSFISKITVKVITLSNLAAQTFHIAKSATLTTDAGDALAGDAVELLGAGAESNAGVKVRSQAAQTAASDINAGASGGVANMVYVSSISVTTDNSSGWIAGADWGIYVVHAGTNTNSAPSTAPVLDIMVEYA